MDSKITPLTREELLKLRKELKRSIRLFWSGKEFRWLSWEELSTALIKMIQEGEKVNSTIYRRDKLYKKIPGAPSHPDNFYADFKERGGWVALLGKPPKPPKPDLTWEELSAALIKRIQAGKKVNSKIYRRDKLYKKIPGAPSYPDQFYADFKERGGWAALLGIPQLNLTWEELSTALIKMIQEGEKVNSQIYKRDKLYKEIPGAPSHPAQFYADFKERGGWAAFLGKPPKPPKPHLTWEELSTALIKMIQEGEKVNSIIYIGDKLYKKIPGAPSHPERFYPDFKERGGWAALLGKTCQRVFKSQ